MLTTLVTEALRRPTPLSRAPQLRAHLVRLGSLEHLLLLTVGHSIWDAASTNIFLDELASSMVGQGAKETPTSGPGRDSPRGPSAAALQRYWRDYLGAEFPLIPCALTGDGDRTSHKDMGVVYSPIVGAGVSASLGRISRTDGRGKPAIAALAAWAALLWARTGQRRLVLGVVKGNRDEQPRPNDELACVAGLVPIRVHVDPDIRFVELVRQIRRALRAAQRHCLTMAPPAVHYDGTTRYMSPLSDASFNFIPSNYMPRPTAVKAGPAVIRAFVPTVSWHVFHIWQFAYLDCTVLPWREKGAIYGRLGYDPTRFARSEVEPLAHAFVRLLRRVAREPGRSPRQLTTGLTISARSGAV